MVLRSRVDGLGDRVRITVHGAGVPWLPAAPEDATSDHERAERITVRWLGDVAKLQAVAELDPMRGHLNGRTAPLRNLDHPASEATRCPARRMGIRW
jgi:hypothetical protein